MSDKTNKASPIYNMSKKSRRVLISALGAKMFGLANVCDSVNVIQHYLIKALGKNSVYKI